MKTVLQHIEHVKGQPHHVRKRVAFAAATAGAALIAFVWLAGSVYTGAFAVRSSSFADSTEQGSIEAADNSNTGGNGSQNIAGAAAAFEDVNAPARIQIVDTASSTKATKKAEQTTIPF